MQTKQITLNQKSLQYQKSEKLLLAKSCDSIKSFKISPTNSLKQQYFVSLLNKTPNNNDSQKTLKSNKYQNFFIKNNAELNKQFGNFVRSVDEIQAENLRIQNTERSSLIALFEKLNKRDQKKCSKKGTLQHSYSLKHSIQGDFIRKHKCNFSNNSSGQLPSTTIQIPDQKRIDDQFQALFDRTKQLLINYRNKLKQSDCEKEVLMQEIQYWKSKYLQCCNEF